MQRYTSRRKRRRRSSVDWTNLPKEILDVILAKLVDHSDYVQFGAVCKSWHSVAIDQKQSRIANLPKRPPMLLFTHPEMDMYDGDEYLKLGKFNLYSITEGKFYKIFELRFPLEAVCLGCSFGWLVMGSKPTFEEEQEEDSISFEEENDEDEENEEEEEDLSHTSSITLFNLLTQKTIQMPRICLGKIRKVILSCNPSTCPDDFLLAALSDQEPTRVAFMRASDKFWTYKIFSKEVCDIIFHKGSLYAVDCVDRLTEIDYTSRKHDDDYQHPRPGVQTLTGSLKPKNKPWYYLVEASNGDLLLVIRTIRRSEGRMAPILIPGIFTVFQLEIDETTPSSPGKEEEEEEGEGEGEVKVEWVNIRELENDDAIFVADNTTFCIPAASCYPNCIPNSIYFAHNFEDKRYGHLRTFHRRWRCEIGNFDIGDGTFSSLDGFRENSDVILARAWISPT